MGRWNISDPDSIHSAEPRLTPNKPRNEEDSHSPAVGRGGSDQPPSEEVPTPERELLLTATRLRECRSKYVDRGKTYTLRNSEIEAMRDIGRFRTVDVQDLRRFVYQGDRAGLKNDLNNLRKQELIEQKTVPRAHEAPRNLVTLTEQGHRLLHRTGRFQPDQRIYHGFVKPKELEHDADLYKVYQRAAARIAEKGGKPVRVRLDFELKESLNRAKEAAGKLPEDMRERWLTAVAEEHGLAMDGRDIHVPDIQVEYQMPDGRIERENLELVSRNYRERGIRGKAAAGFTLYARAGDSARVRRALYDSGLMREVLSV